MTPERAFALKLRECAEDDKLHDALKQIGQLFTEAARSPCGIEHKWHGPNFGRIVWRNYVSGYSEQIVEFQRSLTQFYVDRLVGEMQRLRAEAKQKGMAA